MAGAQEAVQDHTYNSMIISMGKANDIEMGDVEIDDIICVKYGVLLSLQYRNI